MSDPKPNPSPQAFGSLRLNHKGINLTLGDTLRVAAAAYSDDGRLINTDHVVNFRTTDSVRVRITSDGLVSAMYTGTVVIVAELTIDGVMHSDTTYVKVLNERPHITSFSLQTPPGDSAIVARGLIRKIPLEMLNGAAPADPGLVVHYWATDTTVAKFFPGGYLIALGVGRTMVYATTTVNNVKWIDSLQYTVTAGAP